MTIQRSASASTYVRTTAMHHVTLGTIKQFVKECEEAGIPDNTDCSADRAHETKHWVAISARHTEEREP